MNHHLKLWSKVCERCGQETMMRREQRFCSKSCASSRAHGVTSYFGAHSRVKNERGSAGDYVCLDCGQPAQEWSYDGLDSDEMTETSTGYTFSTKIEHYAPRCTPCHALFDRSGESNSMAKISDRQVAEIVAEYRAGGITQTALAIKYDVSQSVISQWVRGAPFRARRKER